MKKSFVAAMTALAFVIPNFGGLDQVEAVGNTQKLIVENSKAERDYVKKLGGKILYTFDNIDAIEVELPASKVTTLHKSTSVDVLQKEQEIQFYGQTLDYGMGKVEAPQSWSYGYTGKNVKIAVIDSGVATHPDLNVTERISFADFEDEGLSEDPIGHGTHVAGIIGAEDNDIGVKGVAPDASIYSVQVLGMADIAKGIDWSIENDMDIINMSLGWEMEDEVVKYLVDRANEAGILVVAAAGNEGNAAGTGDSVGYPAKYENVVSVGATDRYNKRTIFSSTGKVDVAAPGFNVYSTFADPENPYMLMSGTSMSTPYVTGLLALYKEAYPTYTNSQLKALLYQNAKELGVTGKDSLYGNGLAQAPLKQIIPTYSVTQTPSDFRLFSQNGYEVTLAWNPTLDATSYEVLRNGVSVYTGVNHTYADFESHTGSYTYTLIAKGDNGDSTPVSITVDVGDMNGLPLPIGKLKVTESAYSVSLNWSESYRSDKYVLMRNGSVIYEGPLKEFVDKNVEPQTEYFYTVHAENSVGTGAPQFAFVYTLTPELTSKPTGLKATASRSGVSLTWNDMEWAEGYVVIKDGEQTFELDSPSFVDRKAITGKTHTYEVCGVNENGESPCSTITIKSMIPYKKTYTSISLNQSSFKTGNTVKITSVIRNEGKQFVTDADVFITVQDKNGKTIYTKKTKTDKYGKVSGTFTFQSKHIKGAYKVKVKTTHRTLVGSTGVVTIQKK